MKQESNAKVGLAFFPRSYLLKGPGGSSTQSPWWGLLLVSCPCGRAGCVGRRCRDRGDCNLWTMDAWLSLRGLHSGLLSRAPFSGPALSQADPHTRRSSRAFLPFQRPPWGSGQDRHADCHHLGGSPLPCCDPFFSLLLRHLLTPTVFSTASARTHVCLLSTPRALIVRLHNLPSVHCPPTALCSCLHSAVLNCLPTSHWGEKVDDLLLYVLKLLKKTPILWTLKKYTCTYFDTVYKWLLQQQQKENRANIW